MFEAINRTTDVVTAGESLPVATLESLQQATATLEQATAEMKAAEGERREQFAKARDEAAREVQSIKETLDTQRSDAEAARDAEIDQLISAAKNTRTPSKAWLLAGGSTPTGYQPGDFAYNLWARKANELSFAARMKAEQALVEMGAQFHDQAPATSAGSIGGATAGGGFDLPQMVVEHAAAKAKATLGTSASTGGVLIPGATVSDIIKVGRYRSAVVNLVDSVPVSVYQTAIPVRVAAPTRAAVIAWGDTKTNTNYTYGSYTATMYTLAIVADVAKQLLRYSRGAVEQDILGELAHAFELGKAYYILQGSGSSEPYGLQTAIGQAFGAYTTSFTASSTTLAGSIAKAVASAAGDLSVRNRTPEAALVGPAAYWNMVSQGTDTAGFFFAQANGPTSIQPGTLVSPFGIPVYAESQLAGSDDLLVGEWSALDVFYGDAYRVDTSEEAGTRWDTNLVGYRAEQEIGLDARAAVFAGAFQFIADIVP